MERTEQTTDFAQLRAGLGRRWPLILLFVLLAGGAAYGLSKRQTATYDASAKLLFRTPSFGQDVAGASSQPSPGGDTDPVRQAATNQALVSLPIVAQRTAKALHDRPQAHQVSQEITVAGNGQTDVVSVTASDSSRTRARLLANTYARQYIALRAQADRGTLLQAMRGAQREYQHLSPAKQASSQGRALAGAAPQLGVLAALQNGGAQLVQPATLPGSPSSPKTLMNTAFGAALGLLVGAAFAFLLERLNRKLRNSEEIQQALEMPLLGTIPKSKAIARSNGASGAVILPFAERESFRSLNAALRYFKVDREIRSVMVTSGTIGEGKSTVSWNVALAAAPSSRAIVVEMDLRNPSLAAQHDLYPAPGLAEILMGQIDWSEAIQRVSGPSNGDTPIGGGTPDIIASGALPPNPAELIESSRMDTLLATLERHYDLVVVDTTPIGVVSDSFPLLKKADGVIVVARAGLTTADSAERTRGSLERLDAHVLGVVANCVKAKRRASQAHENRYGELSGLREQDAAVPVSGISV